MIDLFTEDEVARAKRLVARNPLNAHPYIREEIVTDEVMKRIDETTGQANDRNYMAYRLEHLAYGR